MRTAQLLLILAAVSLVFQSCENKSLELNVMTFNVRIDIAADSMNNWQYRKDVAAQVIKNYDADIVGMQEVFSNQMEDLKDRLPEYATIGVTTKFAKEKGDCTPLFYKKDKFKVLQSGMFWLSETPEVVGSKGWDASYPRVATWAVLEDIATGKKVFAINTHLDDQGGEARMKGMALLLEKASKLANGCSIVLTGDFNAKPDSEPVKYVTNAATPNGLFDSESVAKTKINEGATFHAFGKLAADKRLRIDYIFVSKDVEVDEYEVIQDKLNDVYVSDHNPIIAKLTIK